MKKILALTLVGTLISAVSCGYDEAAYNENDLDNTKTSAYTAKKGSYIDDVNNEFDYVPSTYSANRVKYYDGLYNDYSNDNMSTELETDDFNNGLITFEHNADSSNVDKLATNALNATGTAGSSVRHDIKGYSVEGDEDMNKISYEIGNTYDEVKDATKEIINDITENGKDMLRDVKSDTTTMKNNIEK